MGLNGFLPRCHAAIAQDGAGAVVIHEHTRKREPASGRIEMAPGVWVRVLGRDALQGCLVCEARAQDIIDAHADGRLIHRDSRRKKPVPRDLEAV